MPNYTDPEAEPNVPNWQEDGNSPFTFTDVASASMSLSESYSLLLVEIGQLNGDNTSAEDLRLQINNITSTVYNYTYQDGTSTTNGDAFVLSNANPVRLTGGWFELISGTSGGGNGRLVANFGVVTGGNATMIDTGTLGAINSEPISSLSIEYNTDNIQEATIRVYGK